ncbi:16S rRNA (guanine(527)-N(7))-methyltransferase RsmG [Comamonadaceae bacterium M7527]|nr:16S rRNA (guanine(527)-N(7))-methyltransferase RsmG [Comamonadaceae bacterium M7527]
MGVVVSIEQAAALQLYAQLLLQWNKVYNLTAIRNPNEVLTHHLLDSLSVVPALKRQLAEQGWGNAAQIDLLDVGSGGGLPGVVLAIVCPELRVSCVDTVAKKAAFVQQVAAQLPAAVLGGRLKAIHNRVEKLTTQYDLVTSRAFASLADFTTWSRQALKPTGFWMAMKGQHPEQEIVQLPSWVDMFHVEQLKVPGLDAQRCVFWLRDKG